MASKPRVLLVDDDDLVLDLAADALDGEFSVTKAANPWDALEEIAKAPVPFEVICSDMDMPGMTGAMLLERVAIASPTTRNVLLTGSDEVSAKRSRHAFGVITKPFRASQLVTLVRLLAANDLVQARTLMDGWDDSRGGGSHPVD